MIALVTRDQAALAIRGPVADYIRVQAEGYTLDLAVENTRVLVEVCIPDQAGECTPVRVGECIQALEAGCILGLEVGFILDHHHQIRMHIMGQQGLALQGRQTMNG
ncbi:hypothetical protein M2305_000105 [Gluconobacter cerinus]|nr:hypothetical protein [Gluconobacter cerinus]